MKLMWINASAEDCWSLFVAIVFIGWLAASVIHQLRFPWWERFARFDRLSLLPVWSFFAPNPGRVDLHVVYRSWTEAGPGEWVEMENGNSHSGRWIWNPARYSNKAISDVVNTLYRTIRTNHETPRTVLISAPYISLLYMVMQQPIADGDILYRQFAVISTQGLDENRLVEVKYISEMHRV